MMGPEVKRSLMMDMKMRKRQTTQTRPETSPETSGWRTAIDEVQEEHELAMELDKNPLIDNLPSLEKLNELLGEK
jgi:hypothetical protein